MRRVSTARLKHKKGIPEAYDGGLLGRTRFQLIIFLFAELCRLGIGKVLDKGLQKDLGG